MAVAKANQTNSNDISKVLHRLVENTNTMTGQIDKIKASTGEIKDNVEGITDKTVEILEVMESLRMH
jgi:methyl-accepting chemotaxis protein